MPRKPYLLHRKRNGYPPLREMIRAEKLMMPQMMHDYGNARYHHRFDHVVRNPRMKPLLKNGRKRVQQ